MQPLNKHLSNPFVIDLRALAMMRVGVGLLLLADLWMRAPDVVAWLTDSGVLPRDLSMGFSNSYRWSLYWLNGSELWATSLMAIAALFAVMLVLGLRTRIASVASFIMLVSLHNRNPLLLQGGDNLLLLMVFWGCFLPWGQRMAIDASMVKEPTKNNRLLNVVTIAFVIQVLSVYFFSALLKTGSAWVEDGTAIYYALHNDLFALNLSHYWRDIDWLTHGLTEFVWWLELVGPLLALSPLFFVRLRTLMVLAFIAMEVGFIFNLRIGLFPYISIVSLVALLPYSVIERFWPKPNPNQPILKMYFDKTCVFCEKTCYLLKYIFGHSSATISAAQDDDHVGAILEKENSWVVIDQFDEEHLRWNALMLVISSGSRLRWLSAPLAKLGRSGDRIYNWIGDRRYAFGRVSAIWLPWRQESPKLGFTMTMLVAALTISLFWHNVSTVKKWDSIHGMSTGLDAGFRIPAPDFFNPIYRSLRLDQYWAMFAPTPARAGGWFWSPGLLRSGEIREIVAVPGTQFEMDQSADAEAMFKNYRWAKYKRRLRLKNYAGYRASYGDWLCKDWNEKFQDEEQLEAFNIYFVKHLTQPDHLPPKVSSHVVMRHHCTDPKLLKALPVEAAIASAAKKLDVQ